MAVVYVNDKPVDIGTQKLNLIQAALKGGVFIPHYCWHPALSVVASCRMCLVETGERKPDGTVSMQPKVVPACQTPAKDGTVIVTNSQKARHSQAQTLESLLLNHPLDCPVCDKAGECLLQDFSYNFGRSHSRMADDKNTPPNKPHLSDTIALFTDRCILCSRCVRFTREIAGTSELQVINRGDHSEIDIFPGEPLNNKLAGNVVDLCPVGALASKDFLYKQRVWFLRPQKSVCADCSTGCSIFVDQNKDIVYRLRPRSNPLAQGDFICDLGRYGFHYANASTRITQPWTRGQAPANGAPAAGSYEQIVPEIRRRLAEAAEKNGSRVAAVLSPFLTCEEAYLLGRFMKELSPGVRLYLGHVPVQGIDDTYPKDHRGQPVEPVKFTIRAEKCPNRRGVEAVLRHYQGDVLAFEHLLQSAAEGKLQAVYFAASYPPREGGWITDEHANALGNIPFVVVQDLFESPATALAHYVLPGSTFAEKDGTFVNHQGLAQALHWAVRPPQDTRTDGQVFLDLLQRRGLYHAPTLRAELAYEIPYFAPMLGQELGEHGLLLETAPQGATA
jgi:NADH-quinone oxidoreductase subunit G